jgi:hypothetical protein
MQMYVDGISTRKVSKIWAVRDDGVRRIVGVEVPDI